MRLWRCSSRPSTKSNWSIKSSSLEMLPLTRQKKCQEKEVKKENHIGTAMDSLPLIWANNWIDSRLKRRPLTPSTWMLFMLLVASVLKLEELQPHSTSTLPECQTSWLDSLCSRFWLWSRREREKQGSIWFNPTGKCLHDYNSIVCYFYSIGWWILFDHLLHPIMIWFFATLSLYWSSYSYIYFSRLKWSFTSVGIGLKELNPSPKAMCD